MAFFCCFFFFFFLLFCFFVFFFFFCFFLGGGCARFSSFRVAHFVIWSFCLAFFRFRLTFFRYFVFSLGVILSLSRLCTEVSQVIISQKYCILCLKMEIFSKTRSGYQLFLNCLCEKILSHKYGSWFVPFRYFVFSSFRLNSLVTYMYYWTFWLL